MFTIRKEVGQKCDFVSRLEKMGLSYSVIFTESSEYAGINIPVVTYLGVPMDEPHAQKLLDDMYGKEADNDNDGN